MAILAVTVQISLMVKTMVGSCYQGEQKWLQYGALLFVTPLAHIEFT